MAVGNDDAVPVADQDAALAGGHAGALTRLEGGAGPEAEGQGQATLARCAQHSRSVGAGRREDEDRDLQGREQTIFQ